jgi:hypothetical protein
MPLVLYAVHLPDLPANPLMQLQLKSGNCPGREEQSPPLKHGVMSLSQAVDDGVVTFKVAELLTEMPLVALLPLVALPLPATSF